MQYKEPRAILLLSLKQHKIISKDQNFLSFIPGKVLAGFWSLWVMFFVFFYGSNLRSNLVNPRYDPEINSDGDVIRFDVDTIYINVPHDDIELYFPYEKTEKPELYAKV